ncbi:Transposon Ty3-I Gag-Pol polyprotein [Vitis vinifera]|uniref:Transposon Ty3-I Gag-Pol polyprotein n=1 Tax=Vitis vinifera TaxID=29760 RepID=A0A438FNT4_VITVI|nr:Transposon Ty3-I Gag-Pol polyprotein [Vitis vinifera]
MSLSMWVSLLSPTPNLLVRQRLGVGSSDGLYRCTGAFWRSDTLMSIGVRSLKTCIAPARKPLGCRGSACVEVMTTLHGSTPSLFEACRWLRTAEGLPPYTWVHPWAFRAGSVVTGLVTFAVVSYISAQEYRYVQSGSTSWIRVGGRLIRVSDQLDQRSDQRDMDSQIVTVDQFAEAMASIQEAIASLGRRIDGQQAQQVPPRLVPNRGCPPPITVPTPTSEDPHARMDRLEQGLRQLRTSDRATTWEGFDGVPVASLPAKFRMPDIERYTGIGCPRLHLRLYSTVMRAHGLDEPQMITLFPLSLSGAAQRGARGFETEGEESVSSFISRWRGKIAEIIDRPSERDQIQMVLRSLQPRIARHVVGAPFTDFGSLVMALTRPVDVSAIGSSSQRPPRRHQPVPQLLETHPSYTPQQFRPRAPCPAFDQTYQAQPLALPYYATQGIERPPVSYTATGQPCYAAQFTPRPAPSYPRPRAQQTSAPFALRTQRQFSQIGMPLSQALRKLTEAGLLTTLTPRPPPQPIPPQFRMDLHCAYHQGPGHETDRCTALRHAIQDLIDQGLVHLGQPSVTTNPLPAHTTHAVPPPADGIHFLEFDVIDDHIHMLSDDDSDPEPIMPDVIYETSGVTLGPRMPAPFRLVPEAASVQAATVEPLILPHYSVRTPFILIPDVAGVQAPHPPAATARPLGGTSSQEEVRAEDDEILRQLQSTQARISIWSLLASSSTHRDALTRALSQIRVDTTTTPEGLIHMMTAGRATCIVFSDDDLPPEGSGHTRPLYISVGCSGRRVPSVLLDNGSALNVCPLATAIALGYAPSDFGPSTQTVRAYDSTRREVMGTLEIELLIGPATFVAVFQVLRIPTSFNLLLGRPWIHRAGAIPSSLHQKVKFIHDDSGDGDFCRDFVALSFDQHSSTVVLDIMRSMSYLPGMGLGRRQHGPSEFMTFPDRDVPFGLGFIPTEADYRHMARLRRRGHMHHLMGSSEDSAPLRRPSFSASSSSYNRTSLMTLCFPDEIDDHGTFAEIGDVVDGAVPHDEYVDEMLAMSLSQTEEIAPPELASPFDLFGIFDIDDEIAQHDSDDDSSPASDSDPVDQRVSPAVGDTEIVDFGTADQPRELRIGSDLSTDERDSLIQLLRSYLDVFAWSYEDMPGLDPSIVQHRLPLLPQARPVKQKLRRLHPRWSLQVKEEIQKQLSVGFLSVVEYPEWLANVVPVPKKDGKVRVCVDFRDLNKASPKDDFPLPHIDMLVDSTAGHSMLSFMDGFSGYSQILMAPEDMEKTSFITEWGTYCYRVMPFGLKNAGATYQRAATTLFHDMMHRDVEVYVDDMIVKSRDRSDHLAALESERGIEVDPDKIRAILDMPAPRTERERSEASWADFNPLRYLFDRPALVGRLMRWLVLLTEFDIHYVTQKSIRGSIVADHLASLPVSDTRAIDDDFPDEDVAAVTSRRGGAFRLAFSDRHPTTNNIVEYEACILGLETALELGIRQMEVFGDSNLVLRQIQGEWKTRDVKLKPYHAYLELLVGRFDDLRYTHLPRAQNQFADALATLASMIDIPVNATVQPLLIESRSAPAYC